jgi:hypothetical protein
MIGASRHRLAAKCRQPVVEAATSPSTAAVPDRGDPEPLYIKATGAVLARRVNA